MRLKWVDLMLLPWGWAGCILLRTRESMSGEDSMGMSIAFFFALALSLAFSIAWVILRLSMRDR